MSDLNLFDAHCYLGRFTRYQEGYFCEKADLLAEMDHFGIAEALVVDTLSRELDPRAGNPRILEVCAGEGRLHPAWALAPPFQSLPYPLDELPARMAEAGVRAVWLFPGHLHFTLADWNLRPILEVLEQERVPLFVDPSPLLIGGTRDLTNWDAMVQLCRDHPGLPVVTTEARMYWPTRQSLSALAAAPNLHIELSPFWLYQGIEFVCREFGAERLLFGTRLPVREAGGTIAQLQYAEVSEAEKRAIAGDNLRRLLAEALPGREESGRALVSAPTGSGGDGTSGDQTATACVPGTDVPTRGSAMGRFYQAIREAEEPFSGEVLIDIHSHIGYGAPYFIPDSDPATIVRQLRRHGFSKLVTFAFSGLNADWTWGNDFAYQAMREFPDLLLPLAAVHLWHPEEMQREMARCCDTMGFWGVKLHPWWNGYPETGPNVRLCCEFCHERGLILTNHYWGPPSLLEEYAREFPNARLITGHLVTDDEYCAVVNRNPNVYVCTCLPINRPDLMTALSKLDPDKVLFGSDIPDLPLPTGFGSILYARISDDLKRKIMGLNAQRLLDQVAPNVQPAMGATT
ncbi:MAG: amidohydrolase family protein [Armatimonadetes bacterium]|nr:amidohydrolase family protein [Armatimonadota bacterium]